MTEALKPCPFCGDEAGPEIDGDEFATANATYTIFCNGCHASAATEYTYAEAVRRWNTRPEPDARELAKRIEQAIMAICAIGAGETKTDAETGLLCVTADLDMYGIALRVLSPPLLAEIDRLNQEVLSYE